MWAVYALGAATLSSFNPILYKRMLKDADSIVVVWGVMLLGLPLLGLFTLALTPQFPTLDWVFALSVLGSAGLNAIAHLASTRALKLADVSQVTPLLTFSPVFTLLISALFLGEVPSARGLLGVVFVLIGAYWLNRPPSQSGITRKPLTPTLGNLLVLFAGLLWAITPLFEKNAILHTNPPSPRFVAFTVTVLLTTILTLLLASRRAPLGKLALHRREWFVAGMIAGTAPVLGYTAFMLGLVGYVTALFKMNTMMTVIWSWLLLKEQGIIHRLPSSFLMVIGAILIAV